MTNCLLANMVSTSTIKLRKASDKLYQSRSKSLALTSQLIILIRLKKGVEVIFDEFDIFHSLLGEMKPGSVKDATKGGHWFLAECKAATFDVGEITSFGNGFFDLPIKHLRGLSA